MKEEPSTQDVMFRKLHRFFDEAEQSTMDARAESEEARDFYDGRQISAAVLAELKRRGQPDTWINRIKAKVDSIKGIEKKSRTAPKVLPRTPQHEQDAHSVTDGIRFVVDNNDFDRIASRKFDNQIVEGFGGASITVIPSREGMEIKIRQMPWDRTFYDPHSVQEDFSDARYLGVITWMDKFEALQKWPGKKDIIMATAMESTGTDTFNDKPRTRWVDARRERVMIVEIYFKDRGEWIRALFTKHGFIEPPAKSIYLDDRGRTEHPYCLDSAYIDRDNDRYGPVRNWVPIQKEINKRHQKMLHLLTVNQVIAEEGAVDDKNETRRQVARPDGYITVNRGFEFKIDRNLELSNGQFSMLQDAKAELDRVGANAELQGKGGGSQSGRAIQARQQAGLSELEDLFDRHSTWKKQVYRKIWHRIKQFWTEEKWVRVTDDENNQRFVALNQRVTVRQILQDPQLQADPRVQKKMGPIVQAINSGQVVTSDILDQSIVLNPVSNLDVDIIIDEAQDVVALQQEQFSDLVELAKVGVQFPPEVYLQASSIRNKEKLVEIIKQAQQAQSQQAQQAQQVALEKGQAETADKQASAVKKQVEAQQMASQPTILQ